MNRDRERGFTMIELMVALVVSSLLVGMILAIFSRMSLAYRGQQQIAGVQQVLAAARATMEADAKQAGYMATRFQTATWINNPSGKGQWPVQVTDGGANPDQIAFFYADASAQGRVVFTNNWGSNPPQLTLDNTVNFAVGDLVVVTTGITNFNSNNQPPNPAVDANYATYDDACVGQIAALPGGNVVQFSNASPWGDGTAWCSLVFGPTTMMYKFIAHGYRIDATRPTVGALQQSPTGGIFNSADDAWTDIAYGFTDIQVALQVYDEGTGFFATDIDGDGDNAREWLSGNTLTTVTNPWKPGGIALPSSKSGPLQLTISLVARTDRDVEGVATPTTPNLIDLTAPYTDPNFNPLGNHGPVTLATTGIAALQGSRIYRYLTFRVDLRNLGVGRALSL